MRMATPITMVLTQHTIATVRTEGPLEPPPPPFNDVEDGGGGNDGVRTCDAI